MPPEIPGLQIGQGRPGFGLGHGDGDDHFTRADLGHDLLGEVRLSEVLDRAHRADGAFEDGKGDGGRDLGEFLQHDQGFEITQPQTAQIFRHVDAEKAHFRVALDPFGGQRLVFLFKGAGDFAHFALGKGAGGFLQLALIVGQSKIHGTYLLCRLTQGPVTWPDRMGTAKCTAPGRK